MSQVEPFYSADQALPEITLKATLTAILLTILLGASNVYLALKVGTTVAASIPAAVISLAIFRCFKKSNILENNLVQTAASAGEGLASLAAFTIPALIIITYWQHFKFWESSLLLLTGGLLGVFFSVPLRRVLLNRKDLKFPEGTAIGNVLRASATKTKQVRWILQGTIAGGITSLCQTGLGVLVNAWPIWFKAGKTLFGISLGFDTALLGAGYIVGSNVGFALFMGTLFCWIIGIPILSHLYPVYQDLSPFDRVMELWNQHIRYIGVGCMLVAGIWTLFTLLKPTFEGLVSTLKTIQINNAGPAIRTEKDMPISIVLWGIGLLLFLIFISASLILGHSQSLPLSFPMVLSSGFFCMCYVLIFGFITALISGYLVGLIGSTNTPSSGLLILNVLLLGFILFAFWGKFIDFNIHLESAKHAMAIVLFLLIVVGSTAVITNENIQDLKAGSMIGATPWKQQFMMLIGVVVAAFIVPLILELLFQAYGIANFFPHSGMDPKQMLSAPQAGLIATLIQGIRGHQLPSDMLLTGIIIGLIFILIDAYLKKRGHHLTPLAVGLGIYLPPEIILPTFIGGVISYLVHRHQKSIKNKPPQATEHSSILLACGFVAGSALMGVLLAIPFVIKGNANVLFIVGPSFALTAKILSVISFLGLSIWLYKIATKKTAV